MAHHQFSWEGFVAGQVCWQFSYLCVVFSGGTRVRYTGVFIFSTLRNIKMIGVFFLARSFTGLSAFRYLGYTLFKPWGLGVKMKSGKAAEQCWKYRWHIVFSGSLCGSCVSCLPERVEVVLLPWLPAGPVGVRSSAPPAEDDESVSFCPTGVFSQLALCHCGFYPCDFINTGGDEAIVCPSSEE